LKESIRLSFFFIMEVFDYTEDSKCDRIGK